MNVGYWGSDTVVSMPAPPTKEQPGLRNVGDGFTMTNGGLAHEIDLVVFDEYRTPTFAPTMPAPPEEKHG